MVMERGSFSKKKLKALISPKSRRLRGWEIKRDIYVINHEKIRKDVTRWDDFLRNLGAKLKVVTEINFLSNMGNKV